MNTPQECCSPCPTSQTVNIPGAPGASITGDAGINGINAFSFLTTDFTTPPDTVTPITISVSSSLWMVVGGTILIGQGAGLVLTNPGPGTFTITAVPTPSTVTVTYNDAPGDIGFSQPISAGAVVSAVGISSVTLPVSIVNGGTGAINKAAAQTALGLGQSAVSSSNTGLTQAINAAVAQVGTIDVLLTGAGGTSLWLILGSVRINQDSPTFAGNRIVTLRLRDITSPATVKDVSYTIPAGTTADAVSPQLSLFIAADSFPVNTHLQLQIFCDIGTPVNSGGTFQIIEADLVAIPLRLS
jgi:hypothetical protein